MTEVRPPTFEPTFAPLALPILPAGPYRLRPFTNEDITLVEEASGDAGITDITTVPEVFSPHEGFAFLARQHERARFADGYSFCVAEASSDRGIGSVGLWLRDLEFGRADIGYWIVPSARGKRAATYALGAVVEFGFRSLSIPRLQLHIEPWNVASIKTAEAQGFQHEGLLREFERVLDQQRDVYSYVRLLSDEPA